MAGSKNNWQEGQLKNGEEPGQSFVWRFAHIPMDDKSRAKGFASLEDLFSYLHGHLIQGRSPATGSKPPLLEIFTTKEENAT